MLRIEMFVLLGFVPGVFIGAGLSLLIRRYLAWRDDRVRTSLSKIRVSEVLEEAPTPDLLEELSTRDDILSPKGKRNA